MDFSTFQQAFTKKEKEPKRKKDRDDDIIPS